MRSFRYIKPDPKVKYADQIKKLEFTAGSVDVPPRYHPAQVVDHISFMNPRKSGDMVEIAVYLDQECGTVFLCEFFWNRHSDYPNLVEPSRRRREDFCRLLGVPVDHVSQTKNQFLLVSVKPSGNPEYPYRIIDYAPFQYATLKKDAFKINHGQ